MKFLTRLQLNAQIASNAHSSLQTVPRVTYREVICRRYIRSCLLGYLLSSLLTPLDWGLSIQRSPLPPLVCVGAAMTPGYAWGLYDAVGLYLVRKRGRQVRERKGENTLNNHVVKSGRRFLMTAETTTPSEEQVYGVGGEVGALKPLRAERANEAKKRR